MPLLLNAHRRQRNACTPESQRLHWPFGVLVEPLFEAPALGAYKRLVGAIAWPPRSAGRSSGPGGRITGECTDARREGAFESGS